jgi:hypothetical protein
MKVGWRYCRLWGYGRGRMQKACRTSLPWARRHNLTTQASPGGHDLASAALVIPELNCEASLAGGNLKAFFDHFKRGPSAVEGAVESNDGCRPAMAESKSHGPLST